MRGRVTDWKDDRGFGFIESAVGGSRVFFHVSGLARGARRPAVGDFVSFELVTTSDGKVRAVGVAPAGLAAVTGALISRRIALSVAALLVFPALWWLVLVGKFPIQLFWAYVGMSLLTLAIYGLDKLAAKREAQRTPENTLQLFALLGGWPGALLAQQMFRHKSSKRSFQVAFWCVVVVNCAVLGFVLSERGNALLNELLHLR
jgi:uncharacterized membrane protein YsdA (DUF1294 family)/cold shock CspA family protein